MLFILEVIGDVSVSIGHPSEHQSAYFTNTIRVMGPLTACEFVSKIIPFKDGKLDSAVTKGCHFAVRSSVSVVCTGNERRHAIVRMKLCVSGTSAHGRWSETHANYGTESSNQRYSVQIDARFEREKHSVRVLLFLTLKAAFLVSSSEWVKMEMRTVSALQITQIILFISSAQRKYLGL